MSTPEPEGGVIRFAPGTVQLDVETGEFTLTPLGAIKRAVEVLRERAGAATPGPWSLGRTCDVRGNGSRNFVASTYGGILGVEEPNAQWIALADPGLGLLVADWLAAELARADTCTGCNSDRSRCLRAPVACCPECDHGSPLPTAHALAVYVLEKEAGR